MTEGINSTNIHRISATIIDNHWDKFQSVMIQLMASSTYCLSTILGKFEITIMGDEVKTDQPSQ